MEFKRLYKKLNKTKLLQVKTWRAFLYSMCIFTDLVVRYVKVRKDLLMMISLKNVCYYMLVENKKVIHYNATWNFHGGMNI